MIVSNGTVSVPVERHNAVHEIPDLFVVSMENVCAILMNVNAFHIFAIDVTSQVGAFVYHSPRSSAGGFCAAQRKAKANEYAERIKNDLYDKLGISTRLLDGHERVRVTYHMLNPAPCNYLPPTRSRILRKLSFSLLAYSLPFL